MSDRILTECIAKALRRCVDQLCGHIALLLAICADLLGALCAFAPIKCSVGALHQKN